MTDLKAVAELLLAKDNIEILTHHYPDGDTLGSAYALCLSLQSLGKNVRVITSGSVGAKYDFLKEGVKAQSFEREYVVSVDVASPSLLGENREEYEGVIDLCLDHHGTNNIVAKESFIDPSSAAAAEIIFELIKELKAEITPQIANCIYTGVSTDTGCFRYTNTTSKSLRIAAELVELGADFADINFRMFELKTPAQLKLDCMVYNTLEYHYDGKLALIYVTTAMLESLGLTDDDVDGLASIPRRIEGVLLGLTLREKKDGTFKISARSNGNVNAAEFCKNFSGGGHPAAAGCTIEGELESVKEKLIKAAENVL